MSHMIYKCREENLCWNCKQRCLRTFSCKECLDVHLLKPARLDVLPGQPDVVCADDGQPAGPAPYDMISYLISWMCYDIICNIIYDFLL